MTILQRDHPLEKTQTAWVWGGISMVDSGGWVWNFGWPGLPCFSVCFFFVFWNYVILKHNLRDVGWRATKGDLLFAWQTPGDCRQLDPLIFGEKTVVPRLPTNPHRLLPKMYWTGLPLWKCCGLSRRSTRVLLWRIGWDSLLSMPCRHGKPKLFSAVVCIKQHRIRFTDSGSYTVLFSGKNGKSEGGW